MSKEEIMESALRDIVAPGLVCPVDEKRGEA